MTDDLAFIGEMLSDPMVMEHYPDSIVLRGPQDWLDRQLKRYRKDGQGLWLALRASDHTPVGQIGLTLQNVNGRIETEVGYLLHSAHWGLGYATEGARACLSYGMDVLKRDRIVALISPRNLPSQAVAQRLDMVRDGKAMHASLAHHVYATALR